MTDNAGNTPTYPRSQDLIAVAGWSADTPELAELDPSTHAGSGPRVVMLAGNNITIDARVLKAMTTVSQFGMDVVAVGLRGRGDAPEEHVGSVTIRRVLPRNRVGRAGLRGRLGRAGTGAREVASALSPFFLRDDDRRAALSRWELESRALRADRGADARAAMRSEDHLPPRLSTAEKLARAARWRRLRLRRRLLDLQSAGLRVKRRDRRVRGDGVGARRTRQLSAYRRLPALARWEEVLPEILDQELAVGPVLDALEPDVIHVHDVFMLGIGVHAAQRAALAGRDVKVIYDAHEFIPGVPVVAPRKLAAYAALEREFIHSADHVITVSPSLAALLVAEHGLHRTPSVVLNAPVEDRGELNVIGVREVCGLGPDVPLLVYGGGVHEARGVHTAVEALADLPGVHLVVVVKRRSYVTQDLDERAKRIGASDRLHFAPFVPFALVPRYLSSATIGLSPLLRAVNHDVAITNKFCEYLNAGLPIVTSDTPEQAALVEDLDLGAVHRADDPADLARAVTDVLGRVEQLRTRISSDSALQTRFSWRVQAELLREVYATLLGDLPPQAWEPGATEVNELLVRG
ncbi:glycosyltransferase family 4 protein [Knoellia aerolata]|uniref:Glycosyltransferase subfamily 4-like N-terminal domain-containing protein n=1 Tax=Knoellia aerolata DSM 18566 TaxID=1385519 RepID=A0A0A0JUT1_9MICO|nr:glycosyltransferase family 4 protein [Knoellia aerolata]KGN40908.1 hypothetical protein N801_10630 [Knoellia aerolata DSM 18566]